MLSLIIHIAIAMGVDGHRADIVMHKAASTIAAWEGRTEVTRDDVRRAAELALPHRRRRDPFTPPHLDPDELDQAIQSFDASRSASGSDAAEAGMEKRQMSATGEETVAASDQNAGSPTSAGAERQIDPDSDTRFAHLGVAGTTAHDTAAVGTPNAARGAGVVEGDRFAAVT